jgi:hypothetical protein
MDIQYQIVRKDYESIIKLKEIKEYLRVMHEEDDELLKGLRASVVDMAEQFLSKNIYSKDVAFTLQGFQREITLPVINGAKLLKCALAIGQNANQDIDIEDKYKIFIKTTTLIINIPFITANVMYAAESVYQSGQENYLPNDIKLGILQHIESAYDKTPSLFQGIFQLYKPYRKINL